VNAAAKPKRQRIASSEWRIVFLEGSAPALPKIFGTSGDVPSSITENFFGASGDAPSRIFRRMNSGLRKIRHQPLAEASGMKKVVRTTRPSQWLGMSESERRLGYAVFQIPGP
jgi:hypothetical protein